MRQVKLPPSAPVLLESMRAIGYDAATAVADLVDNSITAKARHVSIRFDPGQPRALAILDDGTGMDEKELFIAMRHGSRSPIEHRAPNDLGRFGLGLKTASMSQCRRLTVLSRKNGTIHGMVWDLDEVTEDWLASVLDPTDIGGIPFIDELRAWRSGTLVIWEKLDHLAAGDPGDGSVLADRMRQVGDHLALVFHRFLSDRPVQLALDVNLQPVVPLDPFLEEEGAVIGEEEQILVDGYRVVLRAFTLPHISRLTRAQIDKAGGEVGLRRQQGFYVYRNRRLIVWGTWFRMFRQEELTKLTRVRVDVPNALDHLWSLDIKKSTATPPPIIRERLKGLVPTMVRPSLQANQYRGRVRAVKGIRSIWRRVEDRDGVRYEIDHAHPLVAALRASADDMLTELDNLLSAIAASLPIETLYNDRANDQIGHKRERVDTEAAAAQLEELARQMLGAFADRREEQQRLLTDLGAIEPLRAVPRLGRKDSSEAIDAMSEITERIVSMALVALPGDRLPTEEEIREIVDRLATAFSVDPLGRTEILQKVMARRLVKMDTGFALFEHHVPWVNARRPKIDPFYWSRFKLMLQKDDWAPAVITGLDRSTDEILDLLGNPEERDTWKRRGLVMGDVQSGKTATYSALICKAADAGYRFIVLLTGTIENLRRQTQERLDTGFVGFDSSEQLKRNSRNLRVGVGLLDGRRQATVFTSSSTDFRVATLEALGLSLDALREPALVVVKKHTRILANLRDWVRSYNTGAQNGGIDIPMLMIDDEADNASINTNDPDNDPTAVNAGIRELLALFRRTAYVGFTATPFANIFVNPDSKEEMLGDDLFPRDFIYTLQPATNYFGPRRMFLDDAGGDLHLRPIIDVEDALPTRHKSDHPVSELPDSLIEALCAFLVGNAIRDLRGDGKTHRSMLVNVSQFTRVQDQVEELLHTELERFQTAIRSFSALPPDKALNDPKLRELHTIWLEEYEGCGFEWAAVQRALHDAALPVTTKAVNQRTGPRALDYRAHRDTGLRVVAVGGNSLSRGLTLEGLMISYFRRSTKMYDTLLQMGRWFGYRPGYEDLCRVWLPRNTVDWYGHITEATEELRSELKRMSRLNRTPKDFGLAVRAHPDALLVTARNKMRTAAEVTRVISLSAQAFESVELPPSPRDLERNFRNVVKFVRALTARVGLGSPGPGPRLLHGATRLEVAELLRSFTVPVTEFRFQPDGIAELLESLTGDTLAEWDVTIPSGSAAEVDLGGIVIKSQERAIRHEDPPGVLAVSGSKRRVGSRGAERAGLTSEQIAAAEAAARKHAEEEAAAAGEPVPEKVNVADRFYRAERGRPLLLLHVMKGTPEENTTLPQLSNAELVAIGLSFPRLDDQPDAREVKYKINLVKARELFSASIDPGDDDDASGDES